MREKTPHTNSQNKKILAHLATYGSITQAQAVGLFGCYRLSARIFDLKEQGHEIKTVMCCRKNADGNNVRFAKYVLEGTNDKGTD